MITKTSEETKKLGQELAKKLSGGDLVALYGDLGSGKTTFVQGLARGLGIQKRIISPTFTIMRTYVVKSKMGALREQNPKVFYHIDLYRIESFIDIESLGIKEILNNPGSIVVVEWADKLGSLLPKKRIDMHFIYVNPNKRKITTKEYH